VGLIRKRNIEAIDAEKALVAGALLLRRLSGRVNHADALTNADAQAHEVGKLYTFDERFPSEGLALERPP
jgi:predicted nucleic acid-binding protein